MIKKNKRVEKILKNPFFIAFFIASIPTLIVVTIFLGGRITGRIIGTGPEFDEFAQCLTNNEVKLYAVSWCEYSNQQKELFGDSFQFVDYIDCGVNAATCSSEGIIAYPTWEINGKRYTGAKSLDELSKLSGCELS